MVQKINDGGPAFPCPATAFATPSGMYGSPGNPGMSHRDYFAAKAMSAEIVGFGYDWDADEDIVKGVATRAYKMADAMIAARGA